MILNFIADMELNQLKNNRLSEYEKLVIDKISECEITHHDGDIILIKNGINYIKYNSINKKFYHTTLFHVELKITTFEEFSQATRILTKYLNIKT